MGTITDLSDLLNTLSSGSTGNVQKFLITKQNSLVNSPSSQQSGNFFRQNTWLSLFSWNGCPGGPTIYPPSTPTICDNSDFGGLRQDNPPSGQQQWLYSWFMGNVNDIRNIYMIYDRLAHMGGLSATVTTVQSVNLSATTRYSGASSVGNQILVEIYSQIGATQRNLTINFTNQDGVAKTAVVQIGNGTTAPNLQSNTVLVPLSGNTGVRSVESVQLDGSTGTAGNFGITIIHPLDINGCIHVAQSNDLISGIPSLIEVLPNACLSFLTMSVATTGAQAIGQIHGMVTLINK